MVRRVATGSIYLEPTRTRLVERRLAGRIKTSSEPTDDVVAFGVFAAAAAHLSCVQTRNLTAPNKEDDAQINKRYIANLSLSLSHTHIPLSLPTLPYLKAVDIARRRITTMLAAIYRRSQRDTNAQ